MEEVRGGPAGPFEDLEVIRVAAGMSTARFCQLFDMPERTWRRWQSRARVGEPVRRPHPRPARDAAATLIDKYAAKHPAWGHRKIWAMVRHDGHVVSEATVLRILRDEGLILPAQYQRERRKLAEKVIASFPSCPIPEVARLGRTLRAWRSQVLAYFDTDGLSNGGTEAINMLIEKARRLAHGYRNFENYRLRMLLAAGGLTP